MKLPILLLASLSLLAQRGAEFEVATVKVATPEGNQIFVNLGRVANGRLELGNATLADCLKFAYSLVSDLELEGPGWMDGPGAPRYDVVAQIPPGVDRERALGMLQTLLVERLGLAVHRAPRERSYLALVEDRGGSKLKPANPAGGEPMNFPGSIRNPQIMMQTLSMLLSRFERETILDRTGLKGQYDVKLVWLPERIRNLAPRPDGQPPLINGQAVDLAGPSLATALREQLGLRIESRKGPIDVLIVDRAGKVPTAN